MAKTKTRYCEYMNAIKHTKERLIVDSDYSPFLVGRALMKNPLDLLMVLDAIDQDIKVCGETGNGDVLHAALMALAVRSRMIHVPTNVTAKLSSQILKKPSMQKVLLNG